MAFFPLNPPVLPCYRAKPGDFYVRIVQKFNDLDIGGTGKNMLYLVIIGRIVTKYSIDDDGGKTGS